jgi:ABC-type Mn2+/Zn2+ transport system ATPase subunit
MRDEARQVECVGLFIFSFDTIPIQCILFLLRLNINTRDKMIFPYGGRRHLSPQAGAVALKVDEMGFRYPGAELSALEEVSFAVERGEKVALIGPNGAGKSTLIKAIVGQLQSEKGQILIYGNPVGACHHRVAYMPQRSEINWRFPVTVEQVVMMGRYTHLGWFKRPRAADYEVVRGALEAMALSELATQQVGALSGGQQQRVMLARALAQESDLLLLDEPLNNVDVKTQAMIFDILDELAIQGKTILVSTHDLGTLQKEFHRAIFIDRSVVADGAVAEVVNMEMLARAYGFSPHVCPPELMREVVR